MTKRMAAGVVCLGLLTWGCSDQGPEEMPPAYPAPIQIVEDSATPPPPTPAPQPTGADEFECAPGAALTSGLIEAEGGRDRRVTPHGAAYNVVTYHGEGLTVFGLQPVYVERLQGDDGWNGVGVYVDGDQAAITDRIRSRYPGLTTVDGLTFTGPGPVYPIALQSTDGSSLYIICAPGF